MTYILSLIFKDQIKAYNFFVKHNLSHLYDKEWTIKKFDGRFAYDYDNYEFYLTYNGFKYILSVGLKRLSEQNKLSSIALVEYFNNKNGFISYFDDGSYCYRLQEEHRWCEHGVKKIKDEEKITYLWKNEELL